MQFVIKPNTAFNKVFTMFCEKYGLDISKSDRWTGR